MYTLDSLDVLKSVVSSLDMKKVSIFELSIRILFHKGFEYQMHQNEKCISILKCSDDVGINEYIMNE